MNCPNCQQTLEAGAAFCGNCGQRVAPAAPLSAASPAGVPAYALATPAQQKGEKQALLAVLFGVAGLAGALFMALLGLVLGITGIVMGTMARSGSKRRLGTVGLILSGLAVLASLAVWVYAIQHDPTLRQ